MSEADAIEAAARAIAAVSVGISETPDHVLARAAYAAIAPIVRRDERERIVKAMRVYGDELRRTEIDPTAVLAVEILATAVKVMPDAVCTCPLIDVTRTDAGEPEYVRGDPKGCDVHGGERKRADEEARRKARTA